MAVSTTIRVEMPQMGESVTEGTVLEWHKQEGDPVAADETLVEVSTDKVDAEVPAPVSGTLAKIHAPEGETIGVGALLAEISTNGGSVPPTTGGDQASEGGSIATLETAAEEQDQNERFGNGAPPPGGPATEAAPAADAAPGPDVAPAPDAAPSGEAVDIVIPTMGESVSEGTVLEWVKAVGDSVDDGETLVEISTDKVDAELPAPQAGVLSEILAEAGATVTVGQVIARLAPSGASAPAKTPTPEVSAAPRPAGDAQTIETPE